MLQGMSRKDASDLLNRGWETIFSGFQGSEDRTAATTADHLTVFGQHAMVWSCVKTISRAFPEAEIVVKQDGEEVEGHPVADLLKFPNPAMSGFEFSERWVESLQLTGAAYIWEWRNAIGDITELWPVPTTWVKAIGTKSIQSGDKHRFISHFDLTVPTNGNNKPLTIPPEDMTWIRFPDPRNLIGFIGPLQAAAGDVARDQSRETYFDDMLRNSFSPGLVVRQQEEFSEEAKREMRAVLSSAVGGHNRGKPLFLEGEGASIDVIAPLADLDWPGLSGMSESHICGAFGVPPLLAHARIAQENSPLSSPSLEAAEKIFYRGAMTSLWLRAGDVFTRDLIRNEDGSTAEVVYDTSEVRALQDDMTQTSVRVDVGVTKGVMQVNEARKILGLDEDPTQDGIYLRALNTIETTGGSAAREEPDVPVERHLQNWST